MEGSGHTLIFPISALHLLVDTLLNFSLEYACSSGLVIAGHLQDVGSIDPVVGATAHDMVAVNIVLVNRHLRPVRHVSGEGAEGRCSHCYTWRSIYDSFITEVLRRSRARGIGEKYSYDDEEDKLSEVVCNDKINNYFPIQVANELRAERVSGTRNAKRTLERAWWGASTCRNPRRVAREWLSR